MGMGKAHLTAIARNKPSTPLLNLLKNGKIVGRRLDYGCGKGVDARFCSYDAAYDPYYAPQYPEGKFDTVTCTYVLNVVDEKEEAHILSRIKALLTDTGKAYITVRRDLPTTGKEGKGCFQRYVKLPLPVFEENSGFCTYVLTK